jgi:hypothetical protein
MLFQFRSHVDQPLVDVPLDAPDPRGALGLGFGLSARHQG